jgi:hypothetical protein
MYEIEHGSFSIQTRAEINPAFVTHRLPASRRRRIDETSESSVKPSPEPCRKNERLIFARILGHFPVHRGIIRIGMIFGRTDKGIGSTVRLGPEVATVVQCPLEQLARRASKDWKPPALAGAF